LLILGINVSLLKPPTTPGVVCHGGGQGAGAAVVLLGWA
jgi:hypothetical protein